MRTTTRTTTRRRTPARKPEPVKVIKVNPGLWRRAMALADGDAKRIKVISATKVEITG